MISAMDNRSYGAISKASTAGRSGIKTPGKWGRNKKTSKKEGKAEKDEDAVRMATSDNINN